MLPLAAAVKPVAEAATLTVVGGPSHGLFALPPGTMVGTPLTEYQNEYLGVRADSYPSWLMSEITNVPRSAFIEVAAVKMPPSPVLAFD